MHWPCQAGGGFSGTSGESSSFRYGFFDRTVNWIELVLASGEKTTCSRKDKADLFWGTASSFGTLAIVTLLEIQLVEAKKYVELTYYRCNSMEEALKQMQTCTDDESIEYLDGVVLAKDWYAVCAGRLSNEVPQSARVQRFSRPHDPWFYLQAKKNTKSSSGPVVEAVPIVDYVFRYDRGGFWVGRYAFLYFFAPFTWFFRWLLDWFMHTRVLYHALHKAGLSKENIIQDVAVPFECASEFVEWLDRYFGYYPLWICPLLMRGKVPDSPYGIVTHKVKPSVNSPEYLMNFGVWGPGPDHRLKFLSLNRALERKVSDLEGKKWLYAHAYYTEKEFWDIFDKPEYDALREKYQASYLPNIYQKVHVDVFAKEPQEAGFRGWVRRSDWTRGYYGIYKAIRGGDYLLPRKTKASVGATQTQP